MIRKTFIIAAAVLGAASFAAAAENSNTRTVYVGGHNPAAFTRVEVKPEATAPYALTGSERMQKSTRTENIWVGNRFVGAKVVEK